MPKLKKPKKKISKKEIIDVHSEVHKIAQKIHDVLGSSAKHIPREQRFLIISRGLNAAFRHHYNLVMIHVEDKVREQEQMSKSGQDK